MLKMSCKILLHSLAHFPSPLPFLPHFLPDSQPGFNEEAAANKTVAIFNEPVPMCHLIAPLFPLLALWITNLLVFD